MSIQWFPGHMAKSRRILIESLSLIDIVIELLDARIPKSSRNPEVDEIIKFKPRIIALNKADLADETITKQWNNWYNSKGYTNIFIDSIKGKGINEIKVLMRSLMKEKINRDKLKGRIFRPIRTMVVGIPNVGKSSFINRITGRAGTITADKPGVTRGKQWIKINEEIELLDTPGLLWPNIDDIDTIMNLAITGAIKDNLIDIVEVASELLKRLSMYYPQLIKDRFKLESFDGKQGIEILETAGKNRGCILSGGEIDLYRIAAIVLDEFRGGKIGRITLECPE